MSAGAPGGAAVKARTFCRRSVRIVRTVIGGGLAAVMLLSNATQETAAQSAYEACVNNASAVYDASHAAECKRFAEQTEHDRADCLGQLKLSPSYCDASYPSRDGSPNCKLPAENATTIDAALERARYRCARENGTGQ